MGDTFTLPMVRSSIIRTIWRYHSHKNTVNLRRFEKQAQIKEIDTPKTDRLLSVSDRALFSLPYADMIIFGYISRPDDSRPSVSISHGLILNHPYNYIHNYLITSRIRVYTKPKTYLIIEMIPHLVYYSYATKYHKLSSMFVPGYRCSNVYINVEKGTLKNKDMQ